MLNIFYCIIFKKIPIIDVLIISIGFVLRVLFGGYATNIHLTEWIIILTFLSALFLAFAKRRDDVVLYNKTGVTLRENTTRYNIEFMNQAITIVATITIVAYIMYTVSPTVIENFNNQKVYLTAFFVLAGILRYLQLTIVDSKSGSPTKILYSDVFIQLCVVGWGVSFLLIIYLL